jgi:hypothetical protein
MKLLNPVVLSLILAGALTTVAGCGGTNTALVGRDTLPGRATRQAVQNDTLRTVERVDTTASEIYLRASPGHPAVVTFSAETRVMYLGRVYPVSQLQSGDVIAMQMEKDARGNAHTHVINLQKSSRDWAQSRND